MTYRPDVDGLRAVAVVAVIINHFNSGLLPGGHLGVDIFFVISGYVITSSLERTQNLSLGSYLLQFYARRVKRLLPALFVMILATGTLIRFVDPNPIKTWITAISALFGFSNVFLFAESINYFGASAQLNPFSHTWSLGVEEQSYLLLPLLLRWRNSQEGRSARKNIFRIVTLSVLSAASLILFAMSFRAYPSATYFLTPFRFWELGAGCLLALAFDTPDAERAERRLQFISAIACVLLIATLLAPAETYPVASTIAIVTATVLMIGSISSSSWAYRVLTSRPASYLGRISYSLYLWHWVVICLSRWTVGIHAWSAPLQIGVILLLSSLSFHLVETPLRRAKWRGGSIGIMATGLLSACVAAAILSGEQKFTFPAFSGDQSGEIGDGAVPNYVAKYSKRKFDDCYGSTIVGATDDVQQSIYRRCVARTNSQRTLVFAGDSHSGDMFPMADVIFRDGIVSVANFFQPGCRVPKLGPEVESCDYAETLLQLAKRESAGDVILVIRNNYSPRQLDGSLQDFAARLEKFLNSISILGVKVVYVAPSPKYYAVGPGSLCSRQWYRPAWAIDHRCRTGFTEDRTEQLGRRRDVLNYLVNLSQKRADFYVFDPFAALCGESDLSCTPMRDGKLIYRDDSHLTEGGSELLAAPFEAFLRKTGLL